MKLSKEDLVLYSLHLIKQDNRTDREYTKDSLSNAIGISNNTLDLYITRLKMQGFLVRFKKKYVHDMRKTVDITQTGQEYVNSLTKNLECLLLTEERHNIPSCMEMTKVMAQLPDPLEKAFFLSLYNQTKYFDLPMFLNSFRLSRDETNLLKVFCDVESNPCGFIKESFVESFFNASLYGNIETEKLRTEVWPKEDVNALIILAHAKIKSGRFEDAKMIHDHILTTRTDLTQNQWFITKIGCVLWYYKKGDLEGALNLVNEVLDSVDNKVMQAYAKMFKGQILFHMKKRNEGLELLKSSISSFTTFGLPLFLSIAHNVRGVCYFIMESYTEAEREWIKARRYAREAKSEFSEAKVLPNLADIAMKNGKYDLSRSYLDKASEIFIKYSDFEGLCIVELNLALLSAELKDVDGICDHFKKCKEVAFPYPPPYNLKIYREEVIKRANENGLVGVDSLI